LNVVSSKENAAPDSSRIWDQFHRTIAIQV
jgi:hypothetical protein